MVRALVPALVLAAALLAGCGSASSPSPPTGIDELTIPTPTIDPSDFVVRIDHPYLPLEPGHRWVYRVTDDATVRSTLTVSVAADRVEVAGVSATVVRTDGGGVDAVDYYAQDRAGNVWWLGEDGAWTAGQDGARAGLVMPAHPRVGDGWREAYRAGVVESRADVLAVDASFVGVGDVHYRHVLDLRHINDLLPGVTDVRSYVAGVGLVRSYRETGPARLVELVSGP